MDGNRDLRLNFPRGYAPMDWEFAAFRNLAVNVSVFFITHDLGVQASRDHFPLTSPSVAEGRWCHYVTGRRPVADRLPLCGRAEAAGGFFGNGSLGGPILSLGQDGLFVYGMSIT